ncbi:MAG: DEAD/DEAH box helicase family protein [Thermoplasmata archaeon]|nr:MAG: DEAD/DEAH box helicase family protein [Thermoplasmata archaeon]
MFIEHPIIRKRTIEKRMYQVNIADSAAKQSTLVVLPTGMGKTIIALLLIAEVMKKKKGKILFLAPTKPLVEQHASFLRDFLVDVEPMVFTGEVGPKKRNELWKDANVIVSTPQVVVNDLISARTKLDDFSLIIFDEAHRATGDYAYVFIAEKYQRLNGLVLGMTASPGSEVKRILDVCKNLGIEQVEIRSEFDPDVVPYVHEIKVRWIRVPVPAKFMEVIELLETVKKGYVKELKKYGFFRSNKPVSMKDLLKVQREIRARLQEGSGRKSAYYHAASVQSAAVKVNHALELVETQGISALKNYMERLGKEATSRGGSKASKTVMNNPNVKKAIRLAVQIDIEHPKIGFVVQEVRKQVKQKRDSRIIVFTHYRDTSILVTEELSKQKRISPIRFVGQASRGDDKGLSQKKQVECIQRFKDGEYNVLVATSVAEEGLDIPSTDLVVFYEPVPSEIRTIQRRGRTGRKKAGKVIVLIAKKTRDEAYYWSSISKEKKMKRELHILRMQLSKGIKVGEPRIPPETELETVKEEDVEELEIPPEEEIMVESPQEILSNPEEKEKSEEMESYPETIGELKKKDGQLRLFDFDKKEKKTIIIADTREFNSEVVRELSRIGVVVESQQLDVGDYILSDRLAVERKEVGDFLSSLVGGRLFSQLKMLKSAYVNPLLVLEGEGLLERRGVSDQAIIGALASIVSDFNIPIISTSNAKETANLLAIMVKREMSEGRPVGIRGEKVSMSLQERQQFIIEGLPGVSATLAQRLLAHFGSVKAIMEADEEQLCEVKGIGDTIAKGIVEAIISGYLRK